MGMRWRLMDGRGGDRWEVGGRKIPKKLLESTDDQIN
jgi:hypothetical protein